MNDINETNELNDIILNKGNTNNSNKKIILAVATLGVILIVVIMLMNSLSSNGTDNLPQAVLPPEPQAQVAQTDEEPLFEDVKVVEDKSDSDANLDAIAQKLKKESFEEPEKIEVVPTPTPKTKQVVKKKPVVKKHVMQKVHTTTKKVTSPKHVAVSGSYYIQVGSFSKYEPNKKFLGKITRLGYNYKYHKIGSLNKVLVGPFKTRNDAKTARRKLRSKVEPGAFLVKL